MGENQFNSSFPIALCCYMESINVLANHIVFNGKNIEISEISFKEVFKIDYLDQDAYFAFESQYTPYQKYVVGNLSRVDVVIQKKTNGMCLSALEIKLTALPDNTTCFLGDEKYGSELVVRPDTIVYLACSIIDSLRDDLGYIDDFSIDDWSEERRVLEEIDKITARIYEVAVALVENQSPILLQPIWKTYGKSPTLHEDCLDVFVWTNSAFLFFMLKISVTRSGSGQISRQTRSIVWLYKMLLDWSKNKKFSHEKIIDSLSYNTKNDKAFAVSGNITNRYMLCDRLIRPAIKKKDIKNIILGGGQNLLSPERRFDVIIFNSTGIFEI